MVEFKRLLDELERRGCPDECIRDMRAGAAGALAWAKADDVAQRAAQADFDKRCADPATSVLIRVGFSRLGDHRAAIVRHTAASVWVRRYRAQDPQRFSLKRGVAVGDSGFSRRFIVSGSSTHPAIVKAGL